MWGWWIHKLLFYSEKEICTVNVCGIPWTDFWKKNTFFLGGGCGCGGGDGEAVLHRNQGKVVLDKTSALAIALNGQAFGKVGPRRNHNSQHPHMSLFHSKNEKWKKEKKKKVLMPVLPNMKYFTFYTI